MTGEVIALESTSSSYTKASREQAAGGNETGKLTIRQECFCDRRSFLGAYIGADERFGFDDQDPNQHGFEHVISDSPALESAYREIAELKGKLAQEMLHLEDDIRGEVDF
jgi:hypothetical protein